MTKSRFRPRSLLRAVLLAVIAVVALGLAFTYLVRPALTGPITEITFHQSKPLPDYDGGEYTITDSTKLAKFADLIERHNAVPELVTASTIVTGASGCVGGTSTSATITFASGRVAELEADQPCADAEPYAGFRDEATELLSSWKDH